MFGSEGRSSGRKIDYKKWLKFCWILCGISAGIAAACGILATNRLLHGDKAGLVLFGASGIFLIFTGIWVALGLKLRSIALAEGASSGEKGESEEEE